MSDWEPLPGDSWLTPDEAATVLKVSVPAVKLAAKRGQLPAVQIGKQWRIYTAASRFVPMPDPADAEEAEAV